jgi:hypothetical protein
LTSTGRSSRHVFPSPPIHIFFVLILYAYVSRPLRRYLLSYERWLRAWPRLGPCSAGWLPASQQCFSLTPVQHQPPASQQYFSLTINQPQPPASRTRPRGHTEKPRSSSIQAACGCTVKSAEASKQKQQQEVRQTSQSSREKGQQMCSFRSYSSSKRPGGEESTGQLRTSIGDGGLGGTAQTGDTVPAGD